MWLSFEKGIPMPSIKQIIIVMKVGIVITMLEHMHANMLQEEAQSLRKLLLLIVLYVVLQHTSSIIN